MVENLIKNEWDGVGELEISVHSNHEAAIRYRPSTKIIEETLAKIARSSGIKGVADSGIKSYIVASGAAKAAKSLTAEETEEEQMEDKTNFKELSQMLHQQYRCGEWRNASDTLRRMAAILWLEGKHKDDLKALILAFYIDLSGLDCQPHICPDMAERMQSAAVSSGMEDSEIEELYFDTVRSNTLPAHSMTVNGTYRVFCYCLFRKQRKIEEVLTNLGKIQNPID